MLYATTVSTQKELQQIHSLNRQNLKDFLSPGELKQEGFVSWHYSMELLEKMHRLAPSIIVKDGENVIGYALVTLKEASSFHPDLQTMISNLEAVRYQNKPLLHHSFYLMGQVCIDKKYRGQGVFPMLYQHHKQIYSKQYSLLVTEISSNNPRSLRAHEKTGFKTIHTYTDKMGEWQVVAWDWS